MSSKELMILPLDGIVPLCKGWLASPSCVASLLYKEPVSYCSVSEVLTRCVSETVAGLSAIGIVRVLGHCFGVMANSPAI